MGVRSKESYMQLKRAAATAALVGALSIAAAGGGSGWAQADPSIITPPPSPDLSVTTPPPSPDLSVTAPPPSPDLSVTALPPSPDPSADDGPGVTVGGSGLPAAPEPSFLPQP